MRDAAQSAQRGAGRGAGTHANEKALRSRTSADDSVSDSNCAKVSLWGPRRAQRRRAAAPGAGRRRTRAYPPHGKARGAMRSSRGGAYRGDALCHAAWLGRSRRAAGAAARAARRRAPVVRDGPPRARPRAGRRHPLLQVRPSAPSAPSCERKDAREKTPALLCCTAKRLPRAAPPLTPRAPRAGCCCA